jgi:hypothetical protein
LAEGNLFKSFDFRLLDAPDFLEDSVREELVVPLLAALGYSASPPHRIIRSLHLEHPFVYIGSIKKPITVIPDYLLQRDGENAWILDAKSPLENIDSGKNVEQACSYAIHKDVRVPIYALCNGRKLTVFHISQMPAILDISLQELSSEWPFVLDLLGTRAAWPNGLCPGFLPDFGMALRKAGLDRDQDGRKMFQIFLSVPIQVIARVEDNLYSATGPYRQEYAPGQFSATMLTFDFDASVYGTLLLALPNELREHVQKGLSRQPYHIWLPDPEATLFTVYADPGDVVCTNGNESYCPFIAKEFIAEPLCVGERSGMKSGVLARVEAVSGGWIGHAFDGYGIIAIGAATTEDETIAALRHGIEEYLVTCAAPWLEKNQHAGSADIPNCPEGKVKLPIDLWVCKVVRQTCPIQAQVFLGDPEQFFAGCIAPEKRKKEIFDTVASGKYKGFHHIRGKFLCVCCEDQRGSETHFTYHYPWELASIEHFAPFEAKRDMANVVRAGISQAAVTHPICARHALEVTQVLYPDIAPSLRILDFVIERPS